MVDDATRKLEDTVKKMQRQISRLESARWLENSSITNGRMRFIGGTLRVDSGGRVEIVGYLQVEGTTNIIGPVTISGVLNVTGDWRFSGNGAITGDVVAEGKWTQNGDWEFNGDGDIDGDVDLTGILSVLGSGRINVGTTMVLNPSQAGGRLEFGSGRMLTASAGVFGLYSGAGDAPFLIFNSGGASLSNGSSVVFSVNNNGPSLTGLPVATSLLGKSWVAVDATGKLWQVPQDMGGPMGSLVWPFPASSVTSEFGPRDGGFHEGIDLGQGEGTPIPAAGSGTVIEAVTLHSGWGNYVKVRHSAGLETLYAHMVNPPPVTVGQTVAKRQIIGNVGNTGASQGNHLHFEVYVNGVTVNPRSKLPTP